MTPRELRSRVLGLFRRRQLEHQTEAEMRFHLDMEAEAGMRRGLSRAEAERQARIRAGSVTSSLEAVHDQRGFEWLDGAAADLRQAWTALRRRPGFLLTAGGALAAAVAVTTLVFTMVYGVLLRPLPYRDPDRLVRIFEQSASRPKFPVSIYNYLEDVRSNRTLSAIALYTRNDMQLMHEERAERVTAVAITDSFFPTLGVSPVLGRNFLPSEMVGAARVVDPELLVLGQPPALRSVDRRQDPAAGPRELDRGGRRAAWFRTCRRRLSLADAGRHSGCLAPAADGRDRSRAA